MIQQIITKQRNFFKTNQTKDLAYRIKHLKKLRDTIKSKEDRILNALYQDLGKSDFEGYSSEIGFLLESIHYTLKNIKKWARPKRKRTPLFMPISRSKVYSEPHGVVLIIGPFNYPFHLVIEPLIGAIAAGNTCILKPSEKTPHTVAILQEIIEEIFTPEYASVILGGKEEVTELIQSDVDYIFFTGSSTVGQIIMEAAAKKLTPVTLELGGKSPTIVHKDADIEKAAARIVWGKFYNAGQTCIAPDYIYAHEAIKEKLMVAIEKKIADFYGNNPLTSPDYGRIIDQHDFKRLMNLIDPNKLYCGGEVHQNSLKIAPTVMANVTWDDAVMQEEIFGPILPVLTYEDIDEILDLIKDKPRPLAFYLFTEDKQLQKKVVHEVPFGGGCINDTIAQVTSQRLPFGGTGHSGIGAYHGKTSFETFSHKKSTMKKSTLFDIDLIYPPYKGKLKLLKMIMK